MPYGRSTAAAEISYGGRTYGLLIAIVSAAIHYIGGNRPRGSFPEEGAIICLPHGIYDFIVSKMLLRTLEY